MTAPTEPYVRRHYRVPARRGMRVTADGRPGVITGFDGQYIRVKLDGEKRSTRWHPTWHMTYHTPDGDAVYAD